MGARKCSVEKCPSSTNRAEDRGVTFHRFPINALTRKQWIDLTRFNPNAKITKGTFVCSRHFRQIDFQAFKGTKYLLRQGALPSIFAWNSEPETSNAPLSELGKLDEDVKTILNASKNNDAVEGESSKIIESEKKTLETKLKKESKRSASADDVSEPKKKVIRKSSDSAIVGKEKVVDKTPPIKLIDPSPKRIGQILNFVPGTKIEAQDFNNSWHTVKIVEVDNDDREVLIHFEKNVKGKNQGSSDEWIPMDSSRLRAIQQYKRAPISFVVGEQCLARWSDARKFPATVQKVMERDMYEVLFDDGFTKIVKANHMGKVRTQLNPGSPGNTNKPPPVNLPLVPKAEPTDWDKIPEQPEGEWSCHWYNDAPVGQESTVRYAEGRMIKTIIVRDNRLPEGWHKHFFQRSGILYKWEVLITGVNGQVFRKKTDIKEYFEKNGGSFNPELFDFSLHKKRAKELGFFKYSPDYFAAEHIQLSVSKTPLKTAPIIEEPNQNPNESADSILNKTEKDDFVMMGSIKVNIIENLFRCPEESCGKNFRKENHLQIHIKHYHKEIAEGLGVCPNMQDLAYLRTVGTPNDEPLPKNHLPNQQFFEKVHQHDIQNRHTRKSVGGENVAHEQIDDQTMLKIQQVIESPAPNTETPKRKSTDADDKLQSSDDLSLRDTDQNTSQLSMVLKTEIKSEVETSTSTPKPRSGNSRPHFGQYRRKPGKSRTKITKPKVRRTPNKVKPPAPVPEKVADNNFTTECDETRHSFGSPESAFKRQKLQHQNYSVDSGQDTNSQNNSSLAEADHSQSPKYINEDGEVIKIVRMRQEEIINCICTFPEEDGLMIQCELCLCWQHGICNGIERESEVPEKYICYICRYPHGGRNSMKYKHDQEWLFEGRLPTIKSNDNPTREHRSHILKQTHKLTGNLLELKTFLHSLKIKISIAERKDHPKMYLWSKKWETSPVRPEITGVERITRQKIEDERSIKCEGTEIKLTNPELGEILQDTKENVEKSEEKIKIDNKVDENAEMLAGLLQTPGGTNIDLIKDNKKINSNDAQTPNIPLPEAPIDPTECQHRLLEHIHKQQSTAMQRLQSIEDQIISLESFDETTDKLDNENYTRTKKTIQMLIKDLTTMRRIGSVNASEVYGPFI